MLKARDSDDSFEHLVNLTSFAIFALRAVGHSPSYPAIRDAAGWIEQQQNSDGGFSFGELGSSSDVDDTGAALQALAAAGARNAHVLDAAVDYLIRSQNLDGGFPEQYGSESNAQSTAWAIQGLIAVGRNPGRCAATAVARRSATWKAWSRPAAASATPAPAPSRPCG